MHSGWVAGKDDELKQIIEQAPEGISAKDHMRILKAGTERMELPASEWTDHQPRDRPDVYTDGSVHMPHCQQWAMGGLGVWWPATVERGDSSIKDEQKNLIHYRYISEGLGMYNSFNSEWNSSTRCELAATLIAILSDGPVHTGTDSQAVIDRAAKLQAEACKTVDKIISELVDKDDHQGAHKQPAVAEAIKLATKEAPGRKPWSLQRDGDLWQMYWQILLQKNPRAIKHTKVKGHATEEMVRNGTVAERDRVGNEFSDYYANMGTKTAGVKVQAAWHYNKRQRQYTEIATKIAKTVVQVTQAVGEELDKIQKDRKLQEALGMIVTPALPRQLKYPDECDTRQLQWAPCIRKVTDSPHEYQQRCKVANLLSKLKWQGPQQESMESNVHEGQGTSWLELLALYQRHGGAEPRTNSERFDELLSRPSAELSRSEHKELAKIRKDWMQENKSMKQDMSEFKQRVRQHTTAALHPEFAKWFQVSRAAANRMKPLAVSNKQPCIRAEPSIGADDATAIALAIIAQTGTKDPNKLEQQRQGNLKLKARTYREKGVVAWAKVLGQADDWTKPAEQASQASKDERVRPLKTIKCHRCGWADNIRNRKLTRPGGGWAFLYCGGCKAMRGAKNWTCPWGIQWHQCTIHKHAVKPNQAPSIRAKKLKSKYGQDDPIPSKLRLSEQERSRIEDAGKDARCKAYEVDHKCKPLDEQIQKAIGGNYVLPRRRKLRHMIQHAGVNDAEIDAAEVQAMDDADKLTDETYAEQGTTTQCDAEVKESQTSHAASGCNDAKSDADADISMQQAMQQDQMQASKCRTRCTVQKGKI